MSIEKLISETFTAHEHLAPDSEQVLAATRERIDRGRTVFSRPIVVAAGVVVLTLAAVAAVALNRFDAAPDGTGTDTLAVGATPTGKPAIPDLKMPFSLGWLPPGEVYYLKREVYRRNAPEPPAEYGGEYMLTVTSAERVLDISVTHLGGELDSSAFKTSPVRPTSINGQHGFESTNPAAPGGYAVKWAHPDGGQMWAHVNPQYGSNVPPNQLAEIGRRIAKNVQFPGTAALSPTYGLRDLPARTAVCAFGVHNSLEPSRPDLWTSYEVGDCAEGPSIHLNESDPKDLPSTPGKPVLGHDTRYVDEDGYHKLFVLDAVDGDPVAIAGEVPVAELYAVANSLVLPN
jgi:hypothetical protein